MLCKKLEKIRFETGHAHDFIIRLEQTHFVYASRQSFGFSHHVKGLSKKCPVGIVWDIVGDTPEMTIHGGGGGEGDKSIFTTNKVYISIN